jgi:hypothetical protein
MDSAIPSARARWKGESIKAKNCVSVLFSGDDKRNCKPVKDTEPQQQNRDHSGDRRRSAPALESLLEYPY